MSKSLSKKRILILVLIFVSTFAVSAQKTNDKFSTEANINEDLKLNVCKNDERLEAVKKLFKKMGATGAEIETKKFKNVENLIVTKKGKSAETIIIGAHYDKISDGCGAIDNWTGITIIANLYRSLRQFTTEKKLTFLSLSGKKNSVLSVQRRWRIRFRKKNALIIAR